jgi:Fe-S-cluster containining protein
VWVTAEEIARIAEHTGMETDEFSRRYVRRVGDRYSLKERAGGDCIFWDKSAGCTVYAARPLQCRTWPFWEENVETPEAWEHTRSICPGSGKGQWFSADEITAAVEKTPP